MDFDEDQVQNQRKDMIASVLAKRKRDAVQARASSGIEQIWIEDEDQYNGYDALNKPQRHAVGNPSVATRDIGRSTVFLNITKPKTDAGIARVQEMLIPHDDRPWEVEPTPIPEMAEAADSERMVTLADGAQAKAGDVAKVVMLKAEESAEHMTDWIEDQFVEQSAYAQMREVIRDAGRYGTGILKGPYPLAEERSQWKTEDGVTQLIREMRISPASKRVDRWDFFPDPSCGDNIHNGAYVFERDYLTAKALRKLARDPEYDTEAIIECLKEGPQAIARVDRNPRDYPGDTQAQDTEVFEVWYYYGDLAAEDLRQLGVDIDGEDVLASAAAIVTMVNDRPVRAVLNPLETGDFPYDVFVWEVVDGQVWGRGMPRKMAPAQRMLNAAVRAMLDNAGVSSGPQVIVTKGAVTPADGRYEISGRKLWFFVPNELVQDIRQVMAVFDIPSVQERLAAIIQFALQMADELTALPMLLQGMQGPAPETVGGMTMLQNNANAPLRVIAKQFDDMLIVPHLRRYYDWGMQNGPENVKGDMQVKARGASALVQREQASQFLLQSAPMLDNPDFKIDPAKWVEEVGRANHFDIAKIQYSEDQWKEIERKQAEAPPPAEPAVEVAKIRSQAVLEAQQAKVADAQQDRQYRQAEAEAQRRFDQYLKELDREIAAMKVAADENVSIAQVKAMLAGKSMEIRNKRELYADEAQLRRETGAGI